MSTAAQPIQKWTIDKLSNLSGKTYLITGANSGVGYHAAAHLRRAGADVIVGARSPERGTAAVEALSAISAPGSVELLHIDLASTESIRAASDVVHDQTDGLDAVINNAAIMQTPQQRTADGFELQFGTNHLGHFLLNALLFDLVTARAGRIVPVSSIAARRAAPIDFDDPMLQSNYSPSRAYGQSKLANLIFGQELARRVEAAGSPVTSIAAHPGYAATNLQSTGPTGAVRLLYRFTNYFAQSAEDGALPEVLAAAGAGARNGAYYGPSRFGETRGPVGESRITERALDQEAGRRLWSLSEELLGIEWPVR